MRLAWDKEIEARAHGRVALVMAPECAFQLQSHSKAQTATFNKKLQQPEAERGVASDNVLLWLISGPLASV